MKLLQKISRGLKFVCTFIGALILLSWSGGLIFSYWNIKSSDIKENSVLVIDFAQNIAETQNSGLLAELMDDTTIDLHKLVQAIELASADNRIQGLVAKINTTDLDLAQLQNIARAISVFRQSGKKTYAFSQGFGAFGGGNREYYLATFFDKIYMQPHTHIGLTGINMEIPFFKKVLNKLGIEAEFFSRYEYKTAMMSLTDEKMSPAYREEMQKLGTSLWHEIKTDISANRKLGENIDDIRDRAPIAAEDGLQLGMIDTLKYFTEVKQELKDEGISHFVDMTDYISLLEPVEEDYPVIAWLNLDGLIDSGESSSDVDGEYSIGSDSVVEDIENIAQIDNLKALVVRINSPGGSYNAADEIYFALKKLKDEKHIPVVVSQSGYAASGGYFISLAGDYIFAEPMTITGSIGVLGGKISFADLWKKIGVEWENMKIGQNADILSMNKPFTPFAQQNFNASLDDVYQNFTQKVMENRILKQNIDKVARGRVWNGRDAVKIGLVDELGGYSEALMKAKEMAGLSHSSPIRLSIYPQEKTFSEKIQELVFNSHVSVEKIILQKIGAVDIHNLKLFKRLQYDTVLIPFEIDM